MSRDSINLDEVWTGYTEKANTGQFDPIEEVTIVPADQAPPPRERRSYRELEDESREVTKLKTFVNAEDLHTQRIDALETALKTAHDFLTLPKTGAKAWASDLRYGDSIIDHIEDAAEAVMAALHLIDVQESK